MNHRFLAPMLFLLLASSKCQVYAGAWNLTGFPVTDGGHFDTRYEAFRAAWYYVNWFSWSRYGKPPVTGCPIPTVHDLANNVFYARIYKPSSCRKVATGVFNYYDGGRDGGGYQRTEQEENDNSCENMALNPVNLAYGNKYQKEIDYSE